MADYKKMYIKLLIAVSDAIELLQKNSLEAEELYISAKETVVELADIKVSDDEKEA